MTEDLTRGPCCAGGNYLILVAGDEEWSDYAVEVKLKPLASVAKYRPDLPGLQYLTVNFWMIATFGDPGPSPGVKSRPPPATSLRLP